MGVLQLSDLLTKITLFLFISVSVRGWLAQLLPKFTAEEETR